ncbi:MAG: DUF4124 domain-containing protein [Nitrosomonadales bacterium]|nr:DUF4124 domain-containing protein [Nitrosomonadales bacterium]
MANPKLLCAVLLLALSASAEARLYKWVDDKGITHYGETIPPEYANKSNVELDEKGRVVRRQDVLTPEQQRIRNEEEALRRAEEQAALDARRRDKALLNTYSNEAEIDLARDRSLKQAEAVVQSLRGRLTAAQQSASDDRKESDGYAKTGKPVPKSLQEDMAASSNRAAELQQELAQKEQERLAISARYEAEKQRYRELTGKP